MSCEYQPACPGCPRYGLPHLGRERVAQLEEIAGFWDPSVPAETVPFDGLGSRFRARLSVRGKPGRLGIGIFEKGSHRLVSIPRCGVHHPSIQQLLGLLTTIFNGAGITAYDEARHAGELRAVQLAVEPSTGQVQVALLLNRDLPRQRPSDAILEVCRLLEGESLVQGLFLGALPKPDNSLFPSHFEHVFGKEAIVDECGGARNFFPPGAFGQSNPPLHGRVQQRIASLLPRSTRIVEYYAGVGTLGLGLAARGHDVVFNEVGEGSIQGLRQGWAALERPGPLPLFAGRAGQHASLYENEDTVIVDPPRKGLDRELLERFTKDPPRRLVYLSCGIEALVREMALISEAKRLLLRHLSGWTYFPFTDHVETLIVLERDG